MEIISNNSNAIIILCSHLCVGNDVKPLEPVEWSNLADLLYQKNIQPYEILNFSDNDLIEKIHLKAEDVTRYRRLLDRSVSIAFEIEKYLNIGIKIITRADSDYPQKFKKYLGKSCPPILYCAGDLSLLQKKAIGFVGSRIAKEDDIDFTKTLVKRIIKNDLAIVSGGAKGIDSAATEESLNSGGYAIEFISDSLIRKLKNNRTIQFIKNKKLLIVSSSKPDAGFNAGIAMMRNKYIYTHSLATVIVKAEYNKGGTWAGATENLKYKFSHSFCWLNDNYKGNVELIKKGAIPIDKNWQPNEDIINLPSLDKKKQITFFDVK
jgi:predicted Rossmann fold nucleotide-binding protein DprA/Smf involved in DNA uptake